MTLKDQFQQALDALANFAAGDEWISVAAPPQRLQAHLSALDTLGCACDEFVLTADKLQGLSADELKLVAEQLSRKLTYLLEPISPIETDSQGCVVQMRSNPPHKEADKTSYYELLVSRSGQLSLMRYSRAAGQTRQPIAAHLTREVLARLAGDFSAAAG